MTARIGAVIVEFFNYRLGTVREFHAQDLRYFVIVRVPMCAPSSPTRIMQDMRLNGLINYQLLSRSKSYYRVLSVTKEAPRRSEMTGQTSGGSLLGNSWGLGQ